MIPRRCPSGEFCCCKCKYGDFLTFFGVMAMSLPAFLLILQPDFQVPLGKGLGHYLYIINNSGS